MSVLCECVRVCVFIYVRKGRFEKYQNKCFLFFDADTVYVELNVQFYLVDLSIIKASTFFDQ